MASEVLVLDDDPIVLMTIVDMLHDEGFLVDQAANASEAVRLFREGAPKVLVTDLNLGEARTGLDVVEELRRIAPDLGVVFVTGRPDLLDGRLTSGRQRLLRKPFEARKLAELVWELQEAG